MSWERIKRDYAGMAKPRAVEEVGDIYLIRPLGFLIVEVLRRTAITPTMVSVLAVLAGWLCAWFYYESTRQGMVPVLAVLGALAMLLHSALDSADGQLARLKHMTTPLGRIVDGFCDNLAFGAVYVAIVLGPWSRSGEFPLTVALLAVFAAISHSVQSSLVEFQRTLYLHIVHGRNDIVDSEPERLKGASAYGVGATILQWLHRNYYNQQRSILRSTAALELAIGRLRDEHPHMTPALASRYDTSHRPLLPFWALLASNSHKLGIVVAAFVPVGAGSFWAGLGMGWYFIYVLALNAVIFVMVPAQRRIDRRFCAEVEALADTDCLIIAAGRGSRLAAHGQPKPLVAVGGTPLLERVMCTAAAAGLHRFSIVTGFLAEEIERFVPTSARLSGFDVSFVRNPAWEQPNGISVRCAAPHLGGRFVLLMSDHLFDAAILTRLLAAPINDDEVILAVDSRVVNHPTVDLDDVTKVKVDGGLIRDIGKALTDYNAFDTGIFLCTSALFAALDESFRDGDNSLSGGIRKLAVRGKARAFDIGDDMWIDVDDDNAYARATCLFAPRLPREQTAAGA
jgi:1L-myo-inositol 1-phosphate cytidylyltransferase